MNIGNSLPLINGCPEVNLVLYPNFSPFSISTSEVDCFSQKLINFCLKYVANLEIPVKRGTFVEYRTGLINVSPIGRNCSSEERKDFSEFNKEKKILENFKAAVEKEFIDYNLKLSIGGQISFDVFPIVIIFLYFP